MKAYRYQYEIKLRLASKGAKEGENNEKEKWLDNYANIFFQAADYFNDVSQRAKIKKEMIITEVSKDSISVILNSETSLTTPTLALQAFSRYVAKNETTAHLVKNKALFRGEIKGVKQEEKTMSDAELLKELIDIVVSGRKEQKQVLEEVKDILMNSKK